MRRIVMLSLLSISPELTAEPTQTAPVEPSFLLMKSGQKIPYEAMHKEGGMLIVRSGGSTLFIDPADVAPPPPPPPPPSALEGEKQRPTQAPHGHWIDAYAGMHNLRPELIQAVMEVESGYRPDAISRAGAIGLMQLMPPTAKFLKVNPHDPEQNVEGGARLLDLLIKKYEGRRNGLALALAAYNAGAGAVDQFNGIPPYKETQAYVRKVISRYKALLQR